MSDPNDGCPHCGAALAIKDLNGKPYFLCGSVREVRTDQCKVHGKAWSETRASRVLWEELEKLVKEKGEVAVRFDKHGGVHGEEFTACADFYSYQPTPTVGGSTLKSALAKLVDVHKRIVS